MKIPFGLKTEDELLVYLVQASLNTETECKINSLLEKRVDWNYLIDKAQYQGLMSLLYFNSKKYPNKVPNNVLDSLNNHFFMNTNKNLLFLGELLKLLQIFDKNNITPIPYKGPIMAIVGYGSLSLREFRDIDLFINKKEFSAVKQILINENYEPVLRLNSSKEAKFMESQREFKFKNSLNGINLEIQWNVAGFSFSFPNELYFPISQELNSISINNHNVTVFSDEDTILILSIHAAGHLWGRLSWICDIAEFIKRSEKLNWEKIIKKAQYLAIERILYLNLSLSHRLFDLNLPENIHDNIKADPQIEVLEKKILKIIFTPENFSVLSKVNLRFKLRENKLNGLKDIFRILTIPQSDEWSSFEKNGPTILLYTLKRPLQIIKRLKE